MSMLMIREPRSLFPDLFEWFEAPFSGLRSFAARPIRLEDYLENGHYVVKAELPGIDPEKDVEVTVSGGMLGIRAERNDESETKHRSEFSYGLFSRQVRLPDGADEAGATAAYDSGVLTIIVPVKEKVQAAGRQIPVAAAGKTEKKLTK